LVGHGLTSPPTYGRRFYRSKDPTNSIGGTSCYKTTPKQTGKIKTVNEALYSLIVSICCQETTHSLTQSLILYKVTDHCAKNRGHQTEVPFVKATLADLLAKLNNVKLWTASFVI